MAADSPVPRASHFQMLFPLGRHQPRWAQCRGSPTCPTPGTSWVLPVRALCPAGHPMPPALPPASTRMQPAHLPGAILPALSTDLRALREGRLLCSALRPGTAVPLADAPSPPSHVLPPGGAPAPHPRPRLLGPIPAWPVTTAGSQHCPAVQQACRVGLQSGVSSTSGVWR